MNTEDKNKDLNSNDGNTLLAVVLSDDEKESEKIESLMSDITSKMMKQADEKLWSFFEPYLREAGVKGEITKGKIKWRGIKLKVQNDLSSIKYQLNQRGVDISPVFTVEFGLPLIADD